MIIFTVTLIPLLLKLSLDISVFMFLCAYACAKGLFCSRNWDGWLCWDDTPAGTYASQNCPDYFSNFNPTGEQKDLSSALKVS